MNFVKFLRTPFLTEHVRRLLPHYLFAITALSEFKSIFGIILDLLFYFKMLTVIP